MAGAWRDAQNLRPVRGNGARPTVEPSYVRGLRFFSSSSFAADDLMDRVPYLKGGRIDQFQENTLTCTVEREDPVKVSFFGGLTDLRVTLQIIWRNSLHAIWRKREPATARRSPGGL